MPRHKVPKTAEFFKAKKEVTRSDAKKLRPLTRFWSKKQREDNPTMILVGFVLGAVTAMLGGILGYVISVAL